MNKYVGCLLYVLFSLRLLYIYIYILVLDVCYTFSILWCMRCLRMCSLFSEVPVYLSIPLGFGYTFTLRLLLYSPFSDVYTLWCWLFVILAPFSDIYSDVVYLLSLLHSLIYILLCWIFGIHSPISDVYVYTNMLFEFWFTSNQYQPLMSSYIYIQPVATSNELLATSSIFTSSRWWAVHSCLLPLLHSLISEYEVAGSMYIF